MAADAVQNLAYYVGIDVGASSAKVVALIPRAGVPAADAKPGDFQIAFQESAAHQGNVAACVCGLLGQLQAAPALAGRTCAAYAATGTSASVIRACDASVQVLEDVPAMTLGAALVAPQARCIMQVGAQNAFFVTGVGEGVPQFAMNEGCASGTGSFFEDQMGRLGLKIEDYSDLVSGAASVPRLSGRCAVFAKTDIIHRQQEGVPVEDILLGLCYAMVKSYKATIVRKMPVTPPMLLAGGVVRNAGVVRAVREVFSLGEGELLVSEANVFVQAAGAAVHAAGGAPACEGCGDALDALREGLQQQTGEEPLPRLEPLPSVPLDTGCGFVAKAEPWPQDADGRTPCVLGVDVGSTSTNLVLVGLEGELLDAQYLRTRGDAKVAIRDGLASLAQRLGERVRVVAAATTGSGRTAMGEFIGADVVRDEITAQARAAAAADADVDTVFEIGGQDSKYISLAAGNVVDFQMNKICAAGTGSFVEEQAARLGIPLAEYGQVALSSSAPVDLGERCTVFVETAIAAALSKGATKADVAAGLCQSVVRNYLHRVVGSKPVGSHVVLQGGVAYNPAIVAAFKQACGDSLSVSPWFAVSGAVGAALLALDELQAGNAAVQGSAFKGFDLSGTGAAARTVSQADVEANRAFFRKTDEFYLEGYTGEIDPAKKTVGVPRCLMLHKLFPMVNAFFKQLGFNVLLSDASNEDTVRRAQELAQGETCYPVKLIYGHMSQLLDAGVDYMFMPSMHTIRHAMSKVRHNYACPYMQAAPKLVADALDFEGRGVTLISPLMDMDFGQQALATALLGVGAQLGFSPQESAKAMLAGGFAVQEFTRKVEEQGAELLASLEPGERVLVIITRQYGISDPALNMGIPDALLDRGQKVITVSHLHAHDLDISSDHPDMYWPFGQHMLSGAKLVRRDPRLFAVYLTNHGCGPDSMVSHLFAEEMGSKPYLQIEMDEHFSQVGVITRIEAFLNSLDHWKGEDESALPLTLHPQGINTGAAQPGERCMMPAMGAFGPLAAAWLGVKGLQVELMRHTPQALHLGQRELSSKEYLSFTSMLGMSLAAAEAHAQSGAAQPLRLLLPNGVGSDADGQYTRVVRSVLDARGYAGVALSTPKLEHLLWKVEDSRGLFNVLLAGDIVNAAAPAAREALAVRLADAARGDALDETVLIGAAREAALSWEDAPARKATLALVGEWQTVFDDDLAAGAWPKLEASGYRVMRMPFAEYLWFAWRDAANEDAQARSTTPFFMDQVSEAAVLAMPDIDAHNHCGAGEACGADDGCEAADEGCGSAAQGVVANMEALAGGVDAASGAARRLASSMPEVSEPSTEEKMFLLAEFEGLMGRVSEALGDASPFAPTMASLIAAADGSIWQHYIGANGRYRMAKALGFSQVSGMGGVLIAASMYENTDIALKLGRHAEDFASPVLHLNFDGTMDSSIDEKLRSFLYYVK